MKRFLCLLVSVIPGLLSANAAQDYLAHRHIYKIQSSIPAQVFDSFVGAKVCEVQGIVKGTFKQGYAWMLLVERPDGSDISVETDAVPEWLKNNEIPVRMIVRAEREQETAPVKVKLLDTAPESQLGVLREQEKPPQKPAPRVAAKATRRQPRREWYLPESKAAPMYASFIRRQNPRLRSEEAFRIATGVIDFSRHYGVDARLIMAILMVESGFDPMSTSRSGAMGLGQLMPGTANWMGVDNAYDSVESIYGCVKLIRHHLEEYQYSGTDPLALALAAYNAGEGAVARHGGVPPYRETQAYVRRVTKIYASLCGG